MEILTLYGDLGPAVQEVLADLRGEREVKQNSTRSIAAEKKSKDKKKRRKKRHA